ncbi:MAG TPA: ABC-2 transporter permease [Candidatus Eisenbergiella merdavium]|uniref:ABC-2 transporter permease n=1 Tax=Candidatus Eisenbergiella merdavium TaxID=2838551 RepID=A0A9D2NJV8_9FIRM|nr:ABC-2 transporter permease [Candidatus Eisenbergiella merdavium]
MSGLLKNNFYTALSNARIFLAVMLFMSVCVVWSNDAQAFVMGYMLLGMTGFSVIPMAGIRKESASRWSRYKLTAPVKRKDIVKSYYVSQLLWLSAGVLLTGMGVGLSILLHGVPFDRNIDILMLFAVGTGLSLFAGAVFFPLYCFWGEERSEIALAFSLLGAAGLLAWLTAGINSLFGPHMSTAQIILGAAMVFVCALLTFFLSCPLTAFLFQRKEF